MTLTDITTPSPLEVVTFDLYRDIHKAIRSELFAITTTAGRIDPADTGDVAALATHVGATIKLLVDHATHEDAHIQPAIEQHLPDLAAQVETDHAVLEDRMTDLSNWAGTMVAAPADVRRAEVHRLYVELASFSAAYLAHQDVEERVVMPALERAIGVDRVIGVHTALIGSIPPDEMATSLALMLPSMNVDDRVELLGGMQAGAPPEVFEGVWSLAGSVLEPRDFAAVGRRLGR